MGGRRRVSRPEINVRMIAPRFIQLRIEARRVFSRSTKGAYIAPDVSMLFRVSREFAKETTLFC